MKKVELERSLRSVIEMDEYSEHPDLYGTRSTAIEIPEVKKVLPLKNPNTDVGPGIYYRQGEIIAPIIKPSPETEYEYSSDKIIDFSNAKDIGEIMQKNALLRDIQQDLMVSGKDNIFTLNISQEDTPEMKALKSAINAKQVDKKAYEDRFDQFQNDMRLLKGHTITLAKMISICNGFDIACELTLKDKEGAANLMGTEITLDLTEGRPVKNDAT